MVLPGAKVYQNRNLPTESYLRHHPNPQMRVGPTHEYVDSMMKQKVADSVLHRVVEHDAAHQHPQQYSNGPKVGTFIDISLVTNKLFNINCFD